MTQKLLILERDTKEELQKAIEENVLNTNMRLVSFSVLETEVKLEYGDILPAPKCYEAWCVVSVPDKNDRFYEEVEKMGMSE